MNLDEDAIKACADLIGRTGATEFQIGYLDDDVPIEKARWYAYAQFKGTRLMVQDMPGPVEAANALVSKCLEGGRCRSCGGVVTLTSYGPVIPMWTMLSDGTRWEFEEANAAGRCRWRRMGDKWVAGCQLR